MVTTEIAALLQAAAAWTRSRPTRRVPVVCSGSSHCGVRASSATACSPFGLRRSSPSSPPGAAGWVRSEMSTTSTTAQRRHARAKAKAYFGSRDRQRRLAEAKVVASDRELIEQAIREGRVRRVAPGASRQ